jgi:hypothetical protein
MLQVESEIYLAVWEPHDYPPKHFRLTLMFREFAVVIVAVARYVEFEVPTTTRQDYCRAR